VDRGARTCAECGHPLARRRVPVFWPWALLGLAVAGAGVVARLRAPVGARPVPAHVDAALHGAPLPIAPDTSASPAVVTGTLRLVVKPAARVELDGHPLGTLGARDVTLGPGVHRVRVVHPAYAPLERAVRVPPDGTATLDVDLRRHGRALARSRAP
jgi:hypothetical protein